MTRSIFRIRSRFTRGASNSNYTTEPVFVPLFSHLGRQGAADRRRTNRRFQLSEKSAKSTVQIFPMSGEPCGARLPRRGSPYPPFQRLEKSPASRKAPRFRGGAAVNDRMRWRRYYACARIASRTAGSSSSESIQCAAPTSCSARCDVRMATTCIPARTPDSTPDGASSRTMHVDGSAPSDSAPLL